MSRNYKVQTRFLFHTNIKIKIPEDYYTETVFDELYGILEDVNEKYNSYSENSFIDRINKNNGNFVEVNEEMIEILERVIYSFCNSSCVFCSFLAITFNFLCNFSLPSFTSLFQYPLNLRVRQRDRHRREGGR